MNKFWQHTDEFAGHGVCFKEGFPSYSLSSLSRTPRFIFICLICPVPRRTTVKYLLALCWRPSCFGCWQNSLSIMCILNCMGFISSRVRALCCDQTIFSSLVPKARWGWCVWHVPTFFSGVSLLKTSMKVGLLTGLLLVVADHSLVSIWRWSNQRDA